MQAGEGVGQGGAGGGEGGSCRQGSWKGRNLGWQSRGSHLALQLLGPFLLLIGHILIVKGSKAGNHVLGGLLQLLLASQLGVAAGPEAADQAPPLVVCLPAGPSIPQASLQYNAISTPNEVDVLNSAFCLYPSHAASQIACSAMHAKAVEVDALNNASAYTLAICLKACCPSLQSHDRLDEQCYDKACCLQTSLQCSVQSLQPLRL